MIWEFSLVTLNSYLNVSVLENMLQVIASPWSHFHNFKFFRINWQEGRRGRTAAFLSDFPLADKEAATLQIYCILDLPRSQEMELEPASPSLGQRDCGRASGSACACSCSDKPLPSGTRSPGQYRSGWFCSLGAGSPTREEWNTHTSKRQGGLLGILLRVFCNYFRLK